MSDDSDEDRIRALEDEVRRLSLMLESAPDFITRITVDGKFLYLNRLAPGYQMSDVVGTSVDGYVPAEFRERAWKAMALARETGTVQEYATLGRTSVGSVGHYLTRVSPVIEDGKVTSLVMIATDVTALEQSRTLLQVALEATGLGIWTHDASGAGTWDDMTRRIFGAPDGFVAPHLDDVLRERIHEADRERVRQSMADAEHTGRHGPIEHRIVRFDGEVRWVAASGVVLRDHEGAVLRIVGSVQDITHRRLLEARLLEAQKLESIGRLAGGVAHDFNNMLTAILGNVDQAQEASSLPEAQQLLSEIRVTAERSAALTAQLLAFARRQMIEPTVLEPGALLHRLNALLRRLLGEQIEFEVALESSFCVRVDASQLEQVILNLITNARDSMPQGGRLKLTTADVVVDETSAERQPELAAGAYLRISITDSGVGIPAEALPHVFEPFFTTRQGGTGLGLATCYGIVKQSGGHITVHSEPNRGSTFSVFLPRVAAKEPDSVVPLTPKPGAVAGERVLVVEDEAAVRSVLERSLSHARYHVVVACSGDEALRVAEIEERFDLLITDAVMPGMSGWEVGKRLGALSPGLRILYISGYTEDAIAQGGALPPGQKFLQKPFRPADLLSTVRQLLDERLKA